MAVRRVPEDHPDVQSAVDASAPGDRIEVGPGVVSSRAVVTVDSLTIDQSGTGIFDSGEYTLGAGVRSLALPGPTLFRATGNGSDNLIIGGPSTSFLYGGGGSDVLVGGTRADSMEGGTGNDTYEVDDAASPGGQGGGNRVPLFFGDRVVEKPDEGWDAVWASVDFALPDHVEGLVLAGGARNGFGGFGRNLLVGNGLDNLLDGLGGGDEMRGGAGDDTYVVDVRGDRVVEAEGAGTDEVRASVDYELPANVEHLALGGAAAWGSGNERDNRIAGNALDNRLVGWAGDDTLTGGEGDDVFYFLETAPFRSTVTDFWPGAGSNDRLAFAFDLFPSREAVLAAARQAGTDVVISREGADRVVVLQNTRVADLTLDDILIA